MSSAGFLSAWSMWGLRGSQDRAQGALWHMGGDKVWGSLGLF